MKNFLSAFLVGLLILAPVSEAKGPGHSVIERGKSGGSVSDTVYGAGWNADTTTAPSKNAVYDKIEAIVVGDPVFFDDAATAGNVTYVGCSDSIASAITAATAGDTLVLGSCGYTVSATLNVSKALTIIGQGESTKLTPASGLTNSNLFYVTANNVNIGKFKVNYVGATNPMSSVGYVDATATTVFDNVNFFDIDVYTVSSGNGNCGRFVYQDSGGAIRNVHSDVTCTQSGATQLYTGVFKYVLASAEASTTLKIYDSVFRGTNTDSSHSGQHRAVMNWNNGADESAASTYMYSYNSEYITINSAASDTSDTEAMEHQGNRVYGYFYGGLIDGTTWALPGASANPADLRCHDGALCNFYATTFGRALDEGDTGGGVTKIWGYMHTNGIIGDAPTQAPTSLNAIPAIQLTGAQGGDKPGTGAQAGLIGGGVVLTGGAGGAATAATTTGTGGAGSPFTFTTGAGGAQTTATSTTNVGGAGGNFQIIGGAGGVANSAATTNTGGAGADIYIRGGAGGVGTTTTGAAGDVLLGIDSGGNLGGNVGIGTLTPAAMLDISKIGGSTATNHGTLNLSRNDSSVSSQDVIGQIQFWGNDTSMTTQNSFATIDVLATSAISTDQALGAMRFKFALTAAAAPIEVMRISSVGVVLNEQSQGAGTDLTTPLRVEGDADANLIYVDGTNSKVAFGTATATAKVGILSTTEQLRIQYDASNYYSTTVGSTGGVTYDAVGAGSKFTFSDAVQALDYYSGDGTVGVTVTTCTGFKDGLCISGT